MTDHADLRQQLVRHANRLQPLGLATGTSGNLSVRVEGGMLITPSATAYHTLHPDDLVPVQFTGPGTATWQHPLDPSSEWAMHQAVYQARPEAGAVVHGHPSYATVLAIQGLEIPALHYMIAAAGGAPIRCAPYHTYGTAALSAAAVEALEGRKACLLEHHGLLAFEHNLDKAMWLAGEVETLAQQMVMCLSLGGPRVLPAAEIAVVVDKFSRYGLKSRTPR
ncbi:MAG: class II aldolase [Burkholderiaceae bacterium]|nr:MAG: class II aldolase [Burkholderiaceae bacterium]